MFVIFDGQCFNAKYHLFLCSIDRSFLVSTFYCLSQLIPYLDPNRDRNIYIWPLLSKFDTVLFRV